MIRPIHDLNYIPDYNVFTFRIDPMRLYDNEFVEWNKYDVVIMSYATHLKQAKKEGLEVPVIFVSHGTLNNDDIPIDDLCNYKVGVSDHITKKFKCNETINNGINLNAFSPVNGLKVDPEMAVYISRERLPYQLRKVFQELNIVLLHARIYPNVAELIQESDFVIGYGRGVYEGMAGGRPVLVYGEHGCDGWINEHNFPIYLQSNCSGFYTECQYDNEGLIDLILKYDYRQGKVNRRLAKKYLSSVEMGKKFDRIIMEITNDKRQDSGGV